MYPPDSIFAPRSCQALLPVGRLWPSDDDDDDDDDDSDGDVHDDTDDDSDDGDDNDYNEARQQTDSYAQSIIQP